MSERKHPPLNKIAVGDKFRVIVTNLAQGLYYEFQVCGDMGPNRPATFSCHIYDSRSFSHSAYIETETVATDSSGPLRCSASGKTIDELVHNLDWAHKPSELALLKSLLSTRVTTNDSSPVVDLVSRQMSPEETERHQQRMSHQAQKDIDDQVRSITDQVTYAVEQSKEDAVRAARFGLRLEIQPDLSGVKPRR